MTLESLYGRGGGTVVAFGNGCPCYIRTDFDNCGLGSMIWIMCCLSMVGAPALGSCVCLCVHVPSQMCVCGCVYQHAQVAFQLVRAHTRAFAQALRVNGWVFQGVRSGEEPSPSAQLSWKIAACVTFEEVPGPVTHTLDNSNLAACLRVRSGVPRRWCAGLPGVCC